MLNRASQEGPFSAQSAKTIISCTAQDGNAPPKVLVLRSFWAWKLRLAHDVGKIRLSKMCLLPWRGAHFHKNCKMLKKKRIKKHQQRTKKKQIAEIKGQWLVQNGFKWKKCPGPSREHHFYRRIRARRRGGEGGLMHPKVSQNQHFWGHFA